MRMQYSKKVHDMWEKIAPYTDKYAQIKEDAPLEIKKLYTEFVALGNQEYEAATIW